MRFNSNESVSIEMHCHSTHSDGIFTPKELLDEAARCGLTHICITDHDCVTGYDAALGVESDIIVLPAVEISTRYEDRDIHMLGYFLDLSYKPLLEVLSFMREARAQRVFKIIDMMADAGIDISREDFEARGLIFNRSNICRICVQKGLFPDFESAFSQFSKRGSRFYAEKDDIGTFEALRLILDAGGVPVIAHPAHYGVVDAIEPLAREGLMGVECFHSEQTDAQSEELMEIASQRNLLITGGSDFHGDSLHSSGMGSKQPPMECRLEFLRLASERGLEVGVEL